MIDAELMKKLIGKYITLIVKFEYASKPHFFHGNLIDVKEDYVVLDDMIYGETQYAVKDITAYHQTTRMEFLRMEEKFNSVAWTLRMERVDERIKKNVAETRANLRKLMGLDG